MSDDAYFGVSRLIDDAMTRMGQSLAEALYGSSLLSPAEWDEYRRARGGARYMMRELLHCAYVDRSESTQEMTGLSAWLPAGVSAEMPATKYSHG